MDEHNGSVELNSSVWHPPNVGATVSNGCRKYGSTGVESHQRRRGKNGRRAHGCRRDGWCWWGWDQFWFGSIVITSCRSEFIWTALLWSVKAEELVVDWWRWFWWSKDVELWVICAMRIYGWWFWSGGSRLGRSGMDLGRTPAKSEASSEMNLRDDIVEAIDELLSELETSTGRCGEWSLEHVSTTQCVRHDRVYS